MQLLNYDRLTNLLSSISLRSSTICINALPDSKLYFVRTVGYHFSSISIFFLPIQSVSSIFHHSDMLYILTHSRGNRSTDSLSSIHLQSFTICFSIQLQKMSFCTFSWYQLFPTIPTSLSNMIKNNFSPRTHYFLTVNEPARLSARLETSFQFSSPGIHF